MSSVIGVLGGPEEVVNEEVDEDATASLAAARGRVMLMRKIQSDRVGNEGVASFLVQHSTLWRFLRGVHCDRKSTMAGILDDGKVDDLVMVVLIVGLDL